MAKLDFTYQALFAETTSAEIRVKHYQLLLRKQYYQLDYFESNNYLTFALNAIAYMINHLMVFIGDMMSFLSLNSVNKQLKADVKGFNSEAKVLLAKDCLNQMYPMHQSSPKESVSAEDAEEALINYIDAGYVVPSPFAAR